MSFIISVSAVVSALATAVLVFVNWRLLKKYDRQHGIDLFYHAYPFRKELRNNIAKFFEEKFSKKDPISSLPWKYDLDKTLMNGSNDYKEIKKCLQEASLVFPENKESIQKSLELIEEIDFKLREKWRVKGEEIDKEIIRIYKEIREDRLSLSQMDKNLEFPTTPHLSPKT